VERWATAAIRDEDRSMSDPGAPTRRVEDGRTWTPALVYALFSGIFLLLQGTSTLAARLVPEVDRAFPLLLRATQMVPAHSLLHIATAFLAFGVIALGGTATWWFALLFGAFYAGLGFLGLGTGHSMGLGLKPFDHPFHIVLGLLGIAAAWRTGR
jgi:hypothetical protein